jgi:hypothetical protein
MGSSRTKKSTFISQYGGAETLYITPAQYVVEQLCVIIARRTKKELPSRFWQLPEWAKLFRNQICAANKLLKTYSPNAIVAALRDKRLYRLYSLRSPSLPSILDEYQKVVDFKNSQEKQVIELSESSKPRPVAKKSNNIINKLRNL